MDKRNRRPKQTHRQHGSGSIRELGENRFRLGYDCAAPGEPRRQRFETFRGTKTQAKARLANLLKNANRGENASDDTITFGELANRFLAAKRVEREATTCALYERTLRAHVLGPIGMIKARKLTANHITKLLNDAVDTSRKKANKGKALSATYRRSLRTLISSILEFGVRTDSLARNVAKMVPTPASAHTEHVSFTKLDVTAFIEASQGTPLGALVIFAIGTGLRRGEICGLKWSDIDLVSGEYHLQRSAKNLDGRAIVGKLKTQKSARTDQLPAFVLRALKEHRREQVERHMRLGIRPADGGFVFDAPDGNMLDPNGLSRAFHALIRSKGLRRIRLHDLRHGYASLAFASGTSLKVVSESLGHSSIGITSGIYVHLLDEAKREKSAALDGYLGDAVNKGLRTGTGGA